jgi:hypothetical protein
VPAGGDQLAAFYAAIARAIQALLASLTSNVEVSLTSAGDVNPSRSLRARQDSRQPSIEDGSMKIGFQVVATEFCHQQDCVDFEVPNAILAGKKAIVDSVNNGAFTVAIQKEAFNRNVTSLLESKAAAPDVVGSSIEILEPSRPSTSPPSASPNSDPSASPSAAPSSPLLLLLLLLLLLPLHLYLVRRGKDVVNPTRN